MFDLEKILIQENKTPSFSSDLSTTIETSYMIMAMNGIAECKAELREGTEQFYTSLTESDGTIESITESFSDFFKKVVELIKKFLKFIQKMFDRFISQLNGLVKSDKYIKKHKDVFNRFGSDNEFRFSGYTFTIMDDIPRVGSYYITDTYSYSDKNDISKSISEYKEKFATELESNYEDKLRAWVIGKEEGVVSAEDYAQELFGLFRNGDTSAYEFDVTKSVVDNAYTNFSKYEKTFNSVKNKKEEIDKSYKARQREIESFSKAFKESDYGKFVKTYVNPDAKDITQAKLSKDDIANISLIMKSKADEVSKAMDIHALAFAAKLDAIKARYVQDKTILYKVLYKLGIRESGIIPSESDVEYTVHTEAGKELNDFLSGIEFTRRGMKLTNTSGETFFIEGEYDMMDITNPSPELLDLCVESGVFQVVDGEENAFSSEIFPDDIAFKIGIEDTPNPNNISYDIFVATESMKDAELYNSIQESLIKASGNATSEALDMINENVADSIKSTIRKIWNLIVTMWNKFVEKMDELFKNDVKYLEKYKDIILKRAIKFNSVTCWDYFGANHGVKVAINSKYTIDPPKEVGTQGQSAKEYYVASANTFLSRIGSTTKVENVNELQDAILKQLRGEEVTLDAAAIQKNIASMYEFCYNYKSDYRKSAKVLLDLVDKNSKELEKHIDQLSASIPAGNNQVAEATIDKGTSTTSNSTTSASVSTGTTNQNAYSSVSKTDAKGQESDLSVSKQAADQVANNKDTGAEEKKNQLAYMKELASEYLNYASAILGAKLTFGEEAYKDYMKIIRAHVSMYSNPETEKNAANKTTPEKNTDVEQRATPNQ